MAAQSLSGFRSRSLISIPKSPSSFLNASSRSISSAAASSTTKTLITPSSHSSLSFLRLLRALPCQSLLHHNSLSASIKSFSTLEATSSLNDPNPNYSNAPPKEPTLLEGCDYEHWLVVMEPPNENATKDEIIDYYIKTLAKVVGSEDEARMKIYSVSTRHCYAFGALVSEELSYKIKEIEGVRWVLPDSYLDVENKNYGGEPFINGQAVPYDPKYHEELVRKNARVNERNRRNDRPSDYGGKPFINGQVDPYDPKYQEEWERNNAREHERNKRNDRTGNYDTSRNNDRKRENMNQRCPPNQGMQNVAPNTGGMPPNNMGRMLPNMGKVAPNMGGMPPKNTGNMGNAPPNQGWSGNAPGNAQNFNYTPNTGRMLPNNIGGMPPKMGGMQPNNMGAMPANNVGGMPPSNMGNAPPNQGWSSNAPGNSQNFQPGPNYGNTLYHGATPDAQYQNNYAPNTFGMPPNNMGGIPPSNMGAMPPNSMGGMSPNMGNMGNASPNQGWSGNAPGSAHNVQPVPNYGNTPYHGVTPDAQYQNNYAPNTFGMPPNNMGRMPPNNMGGMPPNNMGAMPPNSMGGMLPNNMGNMGNASPNQGWPGNAPGSAHNVQPVLNYGNTPYHGVTPDAQYQNNYAPNTFGMPPNNMGRMPPNNMGGMPPNNMGRVPPNNMGGMPPNMGEMPPNMGGMSPNNMVNMCNVSPNQGWSSNAPGNTQNFQLAHNYGNTPYHCATPDAQYQNNYAPNTFGMPPNNMGMMPPNNMGGMPPNNMGGMPPNNTGNMGNVPPNQGWSGNAPGNMHNFQPVPNYGNTPYHCATPDAQYQNNYAPNVGGGNMPGRNYQS